MEMCLYLEAHDKQRFICVSPRNLLLNILRTTTKNYKWA